MTLNLKVLITLLKLSRALTESQVSVKAAASLFMIKTVFKVQSNLPKRLDYLNAENTILLGIFKPQLLKLNMDHK